MAQVRPAPVVIHEEQYDDDEDDPDAPDEDGLTPTDYSDIREMAYYIVFIIMFMVVTLYSRQAELSYYFGDRVRNLMTGGEMNPSDGFPFPKTFNDIVLIADWWGWLKGPAMAGLFQESWYNGVRMDDADLGKVLASSKIVGMVRIRQVRNKPGTCVVPDKLKAHYDECYDDYDMTEQDTQPFGPKDAMGNPIKWPIGKQKGDDVVFRFQDMWELNGLAYTGKVLRYSGGGYVHDLPTNYTQAMAEVALLEKWGWVDKKTRAVFVDFTIYNPNVNMFLVCRMLGEFLPSGGVVTSSVFRPLKLSPYVTISELCIGVVEAVFYCCVCIYTVREAKELYADGYEYFNDIWNMLDIVNLTCFLCVMAIKIHTMRTVDALKIQVDEERYINLQPVGQYMLAYSNLNAFNGVLTWLKLFKFLRIFPAIAMFNTTMFNAKQDSVYFILIMGLIMFGFAQSFYLAFNTDLPGYRSVFNSLLTVFEMMLGDFDFNELYDRNPVLGPLLFFSWEVLAFFVLTNIFIAIINNSYAAAEDSASDNRDVGYMYYLKLCKHFKRYFGPDPNIASRAQQLSKIKEAMAFVNDDGDAELSKSEVDNFLANCPDAAELIERFDRDKDGTLDQHELDELNAYLQDKIDDPAMSEEMKRLAHLGLLGPAMSKMNKEQGFGVKKAKDDTPGETDTELVLQRVGDVDDRLKNAEALLIRTYNENNANDRLRQQVLTTSRKMVHLLETVAPHSLAE